ncbi:TRAP transporter small permease subunit [Oceanobacter antarcticus]|jgi:TRAP-type mannitol/chloroaromatic compound transport system permease small subunit|uniref:TRAP transporter small permease protein n=1 Tax=Oceanobacter antarcticus TaxID=3133425 RepID=A0ABW8NGF0_9GAMM|tara:strand:+ start:7823 stop:8353 length:531 start_codon:yes stop_codon:yes gene_type:complete
MLVRLERAINRFSDLLGTISAVLFVIMLVNVFVDVVLRYALNTVFIGSQEMEWHLFAAMFMLAVPYTLRAEGHVRVDLVYERLPMAMKNWIDIGGGLLLLLPFCLLVGYYGIGFAHEAWELGETSGDPGGLPARWVIKAVIPLAFFATSISGVGMILSAVNELRGVKHEHHKEAAL